MALLKLCDVCERETKEFHKFAGNVSEFGVGELCDKCWVYLNEVGKDSLAQFDSKAAKNREQTIARILAKAREATNG